MSRRHFHRLYRTYSRYYPHYTFHFAAQRHAQNWQNIRPCDGHMVCCHRRARLHQIIPPGILAALNPYYAFEFIGNAGLYHFMIAMGAIVLATTGGESMYADLGHWQNPYAKAGST